MKRHLCGWRRDLPDLRDYKLGRFRSYLRSTLIPPYVDLACGRMPRVEDQGIIGSCTTNAATSAVEYLNIKNRTNVVELSRLFAYYAVRVWTCRQDPGIDSGATIRDAMKALVNYGACAEYLWPYDVEKYADQPSVDAVKDARFRTIIEYWRCPTLNSIRLSLADGYPVVGGFTCFESLESPETTNTGLVRLPEPGEQAAGGHAIMFCGYDDHQQLLKFENSWGVAWGSRGYGFLPYDYIRRGLAVDFWTIREALGA